MAEQFALWANGFGFGVFVICGIVLLLVSRSDNAPKVACILFAVNLFYLALRLPLEAFLPEDSALFVGRAHELVPMFSMTTCVMVNLVLIQLTHYNHVTFGYAAIHFLGFFQIIFFYYVIALIGNRDYLSDIFHIYVIAVVGYMLMYTYLIIRSTRRYNKELKNVYVNIEGRSLHWFRYLSISAILLFAGNMSARLFFSSSWVSDIFHLCCTFLWAFFAYRVAILRESYLTYESDEVIEESDQSYESDAVDAQADEVNDFMERFRETLYAGNLLYNEDLTRDDVMHAMSVSHVTLGRNLHAATGMSFSAYVTDLRLERIAELLLKTDDNIESIYYSCGFRSRTTFYRAFSRKFRCSPIEYRRNRGK